MSQSGKFESVPLSLPLSVPNGGTGLTSITQNAVVIGDGTDPLQISTMRISDAGEMTNTLQPCFLAQLSATDTSVTGDGTAFQIGSGNVFTEIYDQGGDFNVNGIFTAPVDGRYLFCANIEAGGIVAGQTNGRLTLVSSNRSIRSGQIDPGKVFADNNRVGFIHATFMDMDAADICTIEINVGGGALVVNVVSASGVSFFSGDLAW